MKLKRILGFTVVVLLISSVLVTPVLAADDGEDPEPWAPLHTEY